MVALVLGAIVIVGLVAAAASVAAGLTSRQTPTAASGAPHFVDGSGSAGVGQVYEGEWSYVGGGVAVFDCDDDARSDLYIAGGSNPATLVHNASPRGGAIRFEAVHDPATDMSDVNGAYPLDIDADGIVDLAVLRFGENVLLRGLGDCRFERANETFGFDGGHAWTTAFSATWEGSAQLPTLAFGNYTSMDTNGDWDGTCTDDVLVRPAPSGRRYASGA